MREVPFQAWSSLACTTSPARLADLRRIRIVCSTRQAAGFRRIRTSFLPFPRVSRHLQRLGISLKTRRVRVRPYCEEQPVSSRRCTSRLTPQA